MIDLDPSNVCEAANVAAVVALSSAHTSNGDCVAQCRLHSALSRVCCIALVRSHPHHLSPINGPAALVHAAAVV